MRELSQNPWPRTPEEIRLAKALEYVSPEYRSTEAIIDDARRSLEAQTTPYPDVPRWLVWLLPVIVLAGFGGIVLLQNLVRIFNL